MAELGLYDGIFYFFALVTLVSGIIVVTSKNIIHSAFSLMFTFFGVAGLYVLLGADFIAIVQILVYVGGILILLLFGVMLTNKVIDVEIKSDNIHVAPALIGIAIFAALLIWVVTNTGWTTETLIPPSSTAVELGRALLTDYVLIFELLGILLLIALIGAASIARRDKE